MRKENNKSIQEKINSFYKEAKLSDIISLMDITDKDVCQLAINVGDKAYRYIQLKADYNVLHKDSEIYLYVLRNLLDKDDTNIILTDKLLTDFKDGVKEAIDLVNNPKYWFDYVIDLENYQLTDIIDNLKDYYTMKEIDNMKEETFNQLSCEAIFENEFVYQY